MCTFSALSFRVKWWYLVNTTPFNSVTIMHLYCIYLIRTAIILCKTCTIKQNIAIQRSGFYSMYKSLYSYNLRSLTNLICFAKFIHILEIYIDWISKLNFPTFLNHYKAALSGYNSGHTEVHYSIYSILQIKIQNKYKCRVNLEHQCYTYKNWLPLWLLLSSEIW